MVSCIKIRYGVKPTQYSLQSFTAVEVIGKGSEKNAYRFNTGIGYIYASNYLLHVL
ncbi:hypothetical protein GCM10026983_40240 [Gracilibacillus alcaliphilus]